MFRMLTALLVVVGLLVGVAGWAEVVVTSPRDGDTVGPSTPVRGYCSERAFVVVMTDVISVTGEKIGTVPGIRHWTNDDNSISVRVATPRFSFGDKTEPLTYLIHVRAYRTPELVESGAPEVGEVEIAVQSQ